MLENLKLDTEVYTGLIGHCFTYSHVKKKVFKVLYTILFKKKKQTKKTHLSHHLWTNFHTLDFTVH